MKRFKRLLEGCAVVLLVALFAPPLQASSGGGVGDQGQLPGRECL